MLDADTTERRVSYIILGVNAMLMLSPHHSENEFSAKMTIDQKIEYSLTELGHGNLALPVKSLTQTFHIAKLAYSTLY